MDCITTLIEQREINQHNLTIKSIVDTIFAIMANFDAPKRDTIVGDIIHSKSNLSNKLRETIARLNLGGVSNDERQQQQQREVRTQESSEVVKEDEVKQMEELEEKPRRVLHGLPDRPLHGMLMKDLNKMIDEKKEKETKQKDGKTIRNMLYHVNSSLKIINMAYCISIANVTTVTRNYCYYVFY